MSESNGVLSKADFLAGILGQPERYKLPGVGMVTVRPLTSAEAGRLFEKHAGDNHAMMRASIGCGLVDPVLNAEDVDLLENAKAGAVVDLAKRIMAISGMGDDEAAANLAGGGS